MWNYFGGKCIPYTHLFFPSDVKVIFSYKITDFYSNIYLVQSEVLNVDVGMKQNSSTRSFIDA